MSDTVLGEAYFALVHHYGLPETEARARLLAMAQSNTVERLR